MDFSSINSVPEACVNTDLCHKPFKGMKNIVRSFYQ
jgi:hypothetical protein